MILSKCNFTEFNSVEYNFIECNRLYKMNDIINKFLLAGDKFMPERHLKQP